MYTNPQPNQNPGFQQPYGYQAPPPKKSGAGCWLWGSLGCLVFLIVSVALIGFGVKQAIQGPQGKAFSNVFGGAMKSASDITDATTKLQEINTAVNQYYKSNGTYPSSLTQLTPNYLPASALHTTADSNPNPLHVSFSYQQPANNAAPTTVYLSTTDNYTMTIGQQTVTTTTQLQMSLNGSLSRQQSQTQSTVPTSSQSGAGASN